MGLRVEGIGNDGLEWLERNLEVFAVLGKLGKAQSYGDLRKNHSGASMISG